LPELQSKIVAPFSGHDVDINYAQVQRLLQDIEKRDHQIETLHDQQNEGQKRQDSLKHQLDRLTYDKDSLQADLSSTREELDEARHNINVKLPDCCQFAQ